MVTKLVDWMLDRAACSEMELGPPQVCVSVLQAMSENERDAALRTLAGLLFEAENSGQKEDDDPGPAEAVGADLGR